MGRKFNALKRKREFWFGNFLFFCHIWKTSSLERLGGSGAGGRIQTQLVLWNALLCRDLWPLRWNWEFWATCSTPLPHQKMTSVWQAVECFWPFLKMTYLHSVAFILSLPYFNNLSKYQTGASEANLFNDPKMLRVGKEPQQIKIELSGIGSQEEYTGELLV